MKKVALHTLGCKLNYSETSTIGRQFRERGYEIVDAGEPSDIFVLNTCSVTERADRECRQVIRRALRRSPETYVIVTGCYAQLQPDEIASIQGVDLILGTGEKFDVLRHEQTFVKRPVPQLFVSCIDDATSFNPAFSAEVGGRTRAFLKIQDGCDYKCSFCTIPLARGSSRSQAVETILEEAAALGAHGYREIVLTGVNVGDFGTKIGSSLLGLLQRLENIEGVDRIRVSSIEPNLLTKELIEFMSSSEKFCSHFHIPLQSGSDTILRAMRRRYTTSHYRNVVDLIRSLDPESGIGVDVIAGFPGETDALFQQTYRFLADLPISYLHVFTYSEREQTPATQFGCVVEPRIRQERSDTLRLLSRRKRRAFHESFVGQTREVLFERASDDGRCSGYTSEYVRVEAEADNGIENSLVNAYIIAADEEHCTGEIHYSSTSEKRDSLSNHSAHNLSMIQNVSHEDRPV